MAIKQNPRYPKPPGCQGCTLETAGFGFAPPSGPEGARLAFVGEALGWEEAVAGEPFYGSAGGTLSRLLHRAGIDRRQCRIHNVIACRPPNDFLVGAPWEEQAISQCRQYLQPVIDAVPAGGVIVPLGLTALRSVLGLRGADGIRVQDFHGCVESLTRADGTAVWVVPSYHPSHLQRGAMNLLEVVTQDLQLAARISRDGFTRSPAELVVDPHPEWLRTWVADHLYRLGQDPVGTHLSLDTEFDEKAGGVDESEIVVNAASPITRVNGGNNRLTGWTVPYREPFRSIIDQLLAGVTALHGWIWLWHKYADLIHLQQAGHTVDAADCVDGMWLWHYLQSDLPRGLGFVAPMASDFGAWKHWAKVKEREGAYAAADGLQNWRTNMWLLAAAQRQGIWDTFLTDWHDREVYVLRPAHDLGVPIDRPALEAFHQELQAKLARVLARLKQTAAEGVLKPKQGYKTRPKGALITASYCDVCGKRGVKETHRCPEVAKGDPPPLIVPAVYADPEPPKTILAPPKHGGGEAKQQYLREGVRLVERTIDVTVRCCDTCGSEDVGPRHRCPVPTRPRRRRGDPPVASPERPLAQLVPRTVSQIRYFWQLPFNPDAPAQILAYLAQQGIDAPIDKKRNRPTTAKAALETLKAQYSEDPFFQLQMDWKAVQKVDATYAVGTLARLDDHDRVHPEILPKPSTLRDSCVGPNFQNVVADKAGPEGLASGFRRCVVARDGLPPGVTAEALAAWEARWGGEG